MILCCICCIGNNSQHKNCNICKLEEIKEEKKNNLENNIKILENILKDIKETMNKTEKINKKMEEEKTKLKAKIMNVMTNIRSKLNEREDELLSIVEATFLEFIPSDSLLKEYEKLPKKINNLLDKKNVINKKLDDSFLLNFYLNDCLNIEKDFEKIKEIDDSIKKFNKNSENKLYFFPENENEINKIYDNIKSFGKIYQKEEDKKNFFISKSEKEINDLQKIKSQYENEIKLINKQLEEINSQLTKEKNTNKNLENQLIKSKIHFTIRSRNDLNKCLNTKDLNYGNSPHLWKYSHNNPNQIFELENNNDGTYSIKNSKTNFYLGFDADKIAFRRKNENSQSFYLYHFDDGFYLFQEKSGAVLDLLCGKTKNGTIIQKYERNNCKPQHWKLVIHL